MTGRFNIKEPPLAGLCLLERKPLGDHRGYLERLFCTQDLAPLLASRAVMQINHTRTVAKGTLRGMHFQYPPHAEAKMVSCLQGEVFDVAVDLRRNSSTFLQWYGVTLTADNFKTLFIPEGFAHGFQTLTNNCDLLYFHTAAYNGPSEAGVNPQDPLLNIAWPLPVTELSQRDAGHPLIIEKQFTGIDL
jgi:dTDP-4-dehydrorhamnose 3,5-epimerase